MGLKKSTGGVWGALWKQQAMQAKKNAAMAAATRRMRLDALDQVRKTKAAFRKKIHKLGAVVRANDKKADAKIEKLTGVVKANAAKSARGRKSITALEDANKNELHNSIRSAIATGEKRAQLVEKRGAKMDKDTRWLVNNKLNTEISKLRDETNASVEALALQSKEARSEMKKEMLYAIRSAADVAKRDLKIAIRDGINKMKSFQKRSAASHAKSALARKALASRIAANAKSVSRMIRDAVATDARSRLALKAETAKAIKKTNTRVDAYANQMRAQAKKARGEIKALATATVAKVRAEQARASAAVAKFTSRDAARQKAALKFAATQLQIAEKESEQKFGKAYEKLAANRGRYDKKLGAAVTGLNDALAKQAALADSRFSKTVKDLASARRQATNQVRQLRKDFATQMATVTAEVKNVETRLVGEIAVVSGEVISNRANQMRVNRRVTGELKRIVRVSDRRFSASKRARGKLKLLMDENKAAAAAEAKELSGATKALYERMSNMQKRNARNAAALRASTSAAELASANALKRAKGQFASKISMLTNVISANSKRAQRDLQRVTGVVHNIAKAAAADRKLIRDQTRAMEADLNKSVVRAIAIGEARAKAVEQRINENLKKTKRYLQTELSEGIDRAADKVIDYRKKGKNGRNLSSIGDLLQTVAALGAVKPPKAEGLGMGGKTIPTIFSDKKIKVGNAVAAINGLVNEYSTSCAQVRARWPMGLGKYLLDKLEESMLEKGVLQVDKVPGKAGNFVYMNGRSVGLSNKLNDFAKLASRMSVYESVLAKLTAKLSVPHKPAKFFAKPPEWQGK